MPVGEGSGPRARAAMLGALIRQSAGLTASGASAPGVGRCSSAVAALLRTSVDRAG
jgi:hypothetical protein